MRYRVSQQGSVAIGRLAVVAIIAILYVSPPKLSAQTITPEAEWPLEEVSTHDGRVYRGLLDSEREDSIEFIEIRRPRGKPMHLVIRPILRSEIAKEQRVSDSERDVLRDRIRQFRARADIEAQQMGHLALEQGEDDGHETWTYRGPWFTFESYADEQTTRRWVVRLGQMFVAFRQVVPPQRSPSGKPLMFKVFGSNDQYHEYLRRKKTHLSNPAFYLIESNTVISGSNVRRVARDVAHKQEEHQKVLRKLGQMEAEMPELLKQLRDDLKAEGVKDAERRKIVSATRQKWKQRRASAERKIATADRRNQQVLDQVERQMFERLYHEAFHAYLENYVYGGQHHDVPRWLNEGLAQVFEDGRLESGTLRIDAPRKSALERLQEDLQSAERLSLAEVLSAEPEVFLVTHTQKGRASSRHYLYSWGLAYYLTFNKGILAADVLEEYVADSQRSVAPRKRFEQLVNMPLEDFESAWRKEMLALKPHGEKQPEPATADEQRPTVLWRGT